ncbi:MAG TPA: glycosyl hydrolase family 18 protein [Spirochaetota bacterium]|nr:glycosyl hydrolase family 18 protein [Spirochaetota bacterium]
MNRGIIWGVILLLLLLLLHFAGFALRNSDTPEQSQSFTGDVVVKVPAGIEFREVWGYLMRGQEKSFKKNAPVTDVFYFSCAVNSKGRLNMKVSPPKLPAIKGRKRRVHLVISELDRTELMHKCLNPEYGIRDYLIDDILELSVKFDGIQIDFESVSGKDREHFFRFLELIKMGLDEGKILSVAVPARMKRVRDDAYDYFRIADRVDRVFVMAYDQHWSTGTPGPVASLSWCRGVMNYAMSAVPYEKLVMGIPLYGRAWYNRSESCSISAGQARILLTKKSAMSEYTPENGIKITFNDSDVIVFFDNIDATKEKLMLYRGYIDSIGFWRLGMDRPELWEEITLRK